MNKSTPSNFTLFAFSMVTTVSILLTLTLPSFKTPDGAKAIATSPDPAPTQTGTSTPSPAYTPASQPRLIDVPSQPIPSQIVIQFAPNSTEEERAAYIESVGGTVLENIEALDTVVLDVPEEIAEKPLPESLALADAEPDYFVVALEDIIPDDPRYSEQWALPAIGAPSAWAELPADAPKVTVAVIDSGICASHPDLAGRIVDGWDFLEGDSMPQDDFGHGCSVSGVIAANMNDGIGIAGVAPNAQIMPLRVLNASGIGSYSDVAAAIVYAADNGSQVINLSLGGSNPSSTLENAVNYAISKGVIVVAAAGNNGTEGALYPAAYPDVIAVGSVDPNLEHSSFSNYGSQIDIWAPGRDILTTKRDGGYGLVSGTSFAAPYVAGGNAVNIALGETLGQREYLWIGAQASETDTPTIPVSTLSSLTATQSVTEFPVTTSAPEETEGSTGTPTQEIIDINSWRDYIDPVYGYAIRIPSNWFIRTTPVDEYDGSAVFTSYDPAQVTNATDDLPPSASKIDIGVYGVDRPENISLQTWVQSDSQQGATSVESTQIFVANSEALQVKYNNNFGSYIVIYIPRASKVYYFSFPLRDTSSIKLIKEILATFNFVSEYKREQPTSETLFPDEPIFNQLEFPVEAQSASDYMLPFTGEEVVTNAPGCSETHSTIDREAFDFGLSYEPVFASRRGWAGYYPNTSYGNLIKIIHPDGEISWYAHLSSPKIPNDNSLHYVESGQIIATSGNTGPQTTGPHLHFHVRNKEDTATISIRSIPVIELSNPNANPPCMPSGVSDGMAYGPPALFENTNYGGKAQLISASVPDLRNIWMGHDNASSLWIAAPWSMRVCKNENYSGSCKIYSPPNFGDEISVSNLGAEYFADGTVIDENITSVEAGLFCIASTSSDVSVQCGGNTPPTPTQPPATQPPPTGGGPTGYTYCADENGICNFSGIADVAYGANGQFYYRYDVYSSIYCHNSVFGDPINGTRKACYYKLKSGGTGVWTAGFYDTVDRWWDNNNSGNYRCSETINSQFLDVNYGTGTRCGMDPDTWVGEYSTTVNFSSGNYVFYVEHDDGLKLWLNGQNIADRGGSGSTYVCPPRSISGATQLKVMLREDGGDAKVKVNWSTDTSLCTPRPSADFDAWPLSGDAPLTTAMHIVSMTGVTSCSWNYGDGQTGTSCSQLHNHTYSSPGSYTVQLTVSGPGGSDSMTRTNYISVSEPPPAPCPTINNWMGEYWTNPNLAGSRALCRDDADLNLDWGLGSPDPVIPADNFSARWTRTVYFSEGTYRFNMRHDDGARLYIDGVLKKDVWGTCCVTETVDVPLTEGSHAIKMEMYENGGAAHAQLWWTALGPGSFGKTGPGNELAIEDTNAMLTWNSSGSATSYEYCLDTSDDNTCNTSWVSTGTNLIKVVTGLNLGTTYYWQVRSKNTNGTTYSDDNTWWSFPVATVQLISVYTTDDLGPATLDESTITKASDLQPEAYKSVFYPDDPIQLHLYINQEFSNEKTVTVEWEVTNPAGDIVPELSYTETGSLGSGWWIWWINRTIPSYLIRGEYTFTGRVTYNGSTTIQTSVFSIEGPAAVEAYDVFVTDGNGLAASLEVTPQSTSSEVGANAISMNFIAGDAIQLYIHTYNDVAPDEPAYFDWSVYDPWGRYVEEMSWSGDLNSYSGWSWWWLPTTIPNHAITGDYNFVGSITYGGRTTYSVTTFHVTGTVSAPSNDGFNSPTIASTVPFNKIQDTWTATTATSDPTPSCGIGQNSNSVWYKYIAPSNGILHADTFGSEYDTVVAIWTGTLGNLIEKGCIDDSFGELQSWLEIPAISGTTYYIEVMDWSYPGGGILELNIDFAPSIANDDFNSPATISAFPYSLSRDVRGATQAGDDPSLTACNRLPGQASVWYKYTPSVSGQLDVDTIGSDYDTMLAVWSGTRGNLTSVGCNDDIGYVDEVWDTDSTLGLNLVGGTTYYIEVSTYAGMIDINGTSATGLHNKDWWLSSGVSNLEDIKTAIDNGTSPLNGLGIGDDINAQFWGGQMQLHADYHPVPTPFNKSTPTSGAVSQPVNLTLSWANSANATSYEYCIDTINNASCDTSWVSTGTATSIALTNLAPSTVHYWQVRAVNSIGVTNANTNNWWSFTTGALPGTFAKLTPANAVTGQPISLTLSWGTSTVATSYKYCIDTSNNNACDTGWVSTGTATSIVKSGLSYDTSYYWHAQAINSIGATYSNGNTWYSFTTGHLPSAFNKTSPSNGATNVSINPTLNWESSVDAASYEYCLATSAATCTIWNNVGNQTYAAPATLSAGTTYYWNVRARNSTGITNSNGGTTLFTTGNVPATFGKSSPTNGSLNRPASTSLTWGTSAGAISYEYCLDTTNDNACQNNNWIVATSPVSLSGMLLSNTTYYWQVRALNSFGLRVSDGGTWWNFKTVALPGAFNKSAPVNLATNIPLTPTLSWVASTNVTNYEYCYDTTNDGLCDDENWISNGTGTSITLGTPLDESTTYYWQVRAVNSFGNKPANNGNWYSFTTGTTPSAFTKISPADEAAFQPVAPTLSWSPSVGATSYKYCLNTAPTCTTWSAAITTTSVTISGLSYDTTYYWHVRASNTIGTTYSDSDVWYSFTTGHLPGSFTKDQPANLSTGILPNPTLSWFASTDATSYEYCLSTSSTGCTTWTSVGNQTFVNLNGLIPSTKYYWNVRARNNLGIKNASDGQWSFTIGAVPATFNKTAPANLAQNQNGTVNLKWANTAGETGYEYCIDLVNNTTCDSANGWVTVGADITNVTVNGLSANTTYYWQLRAVNNFGRRNADGGVWWSFKTKTLPGIFNKSDPANLSLNVSLTPTLSWTAGTNLTRYEYCIDTTNDNQCENNGWINNNTSTSVAIVSPLLQSTNYYWQVRAVNSVGVREANANVWWSFTTEGPPVVFNKISPASTSTDLPVNLILSWNLSSNADRYEYCYDTVDNSICDASWINNGSAITAAVSELNPSTTYYWHVIAYNNLGSQEADSGDWWSFSTGIVPGSFTKTDPLNDATDMELMPIISWSPSTGATEYQYCVDTVYNDVCDTAWLLAPDTSIQTSLLLPNTVYYWQVKAVNNIGEVLADNGTWWHFTTKVMPIEQLSIQSFSGNDGHILELTETSGQGGAMNSTATQLYIGDDAGNRQYRVILSFDTSALPDTAVVTNIALKFRHIGFTGTSPFSTHGNLIVDVRKGAFSNNAALQLNDFKAASSKNNVLSFTNALVNNWYSKSFSATNFQYINLLGVTQFRLRFAKDDNNDHNADFRKINSGNAATAKQPKLVIEYYVP